MKKITILCSSFLFFIFVYSSYGSYLYEGEDTSNLTLEVVEPITFNSDSMVLDFGVHTSAGNADTLVSNELIIDISGSHNGDNTLNIYFDNDLSEKTISLTKGEDSISTTINMSITRNLDESDTAQVVLQGEIAAGEIKNKVSGKYSGVVKIYAEYN